MYRVATFGSGFGGFTRLVRDHHFGRSTAIIGCFGTLWKIRVGATFFCLRTAKGRRLVDFPEEMVRRRAGSRPIVIRRGNGQGAVAGVATRARAFIVRSLKSKKNQEWFVFTHKVPPLPPHPLPLKQSLAGLEGAQQTRPHMCPDTPSENSFFCDGSLCFRRIIYRIVYQTNFGFPTKNPNFSCESSKRLE